VILWRAARFPADAGAKSCSLTNRIQRPVPGAGFDVQISGHIMAVPVLAMELFVGCSSPSPAACID